MPLLSTSFWRAFAFHVVKRARHSGCLRRNLNAWSLQAELGACAQCSAWRRFDQCSAFTARRTRRHGVMRARPLLMAAGDYCTVHTIPYTAQPMRTYKTNCLAIIVTYCNAVKKKIQGVKRLTCGSHAQRAHYLCLRPLSVRPTDLTVAAASSQGSLPLRLECAWLQVLLGPSVALQHQGLQASRLDW